jgi:CO/xanthine dehydrogenase Mo-binding subunit
MADTALTPYDFGTFGSLTTPTMASQMRKMAATMREKLIATAAAQWKVEPASLALSDGFVSASGASRKTAIAELSRAVDWVEVIGESAPLPPDRWTHGGKNLAKVGAADFVTGRHQFTSDLQRPGLLFGRVLRAPSFNAKLQSADTAAAEKLPGVKVIRNADFIGVAAPDELLAQKALEAIEARWQEQKGISAPELFPYLKAHPEQSGGKTSGAIPEGWTPPADSHRLQSAYTVAYIAHVPLEPRSAVAEWNGSKLTVWTGTQRPFGVRSELAEVFSIPEADIRVIVPDTGSAYGGKHTGECAAEAAKLARDARKPVKLIWTREEEFTWAYFRPAGVIEVSSCVNKDGTLALWDFVNYNSGPSGLESPYRSSASRVAYQPTDYPLRQGSYRGLAATANHFARESHIDELAAALNMDPLQFRLKNLDNDRVRAVLEAAASRFGWDKSKPKSGCGVGLACGFEKGGVFACCAEVSVTPDRQVEVTRIVESFECGAIVNPQHLTNQVEGAVVMGLGGALHESINFADGKILNPHLASYPVPRFSHTPAIDIVLVDRKDQPSKGSGETPIMGIAAALANAVHQATGIRVRSMPIVPALQVAKA